MSVYFINAVSTDRTHIDTIREFDAFAPAVDFATLLMSDFVVDEYKHDSVIVSDISGATLVTFHYRTLHNHRGAF